MRDWRSGNGPGNGSRRDGLDRGSSERRGRFHDSRFTERRGRALDFAGADRFMSPNYRADVNMRGSSFWSVAEALFAFGDDEDTVIEAVRARFKAPMAARMLARRDGGIRYLSKDDSYLGIVNGKGDNVLGDALERVREEVRESTGEGVIRTLGVSGPRPLRDGMWDFEDSDGWGGLRSRLTDLFADYAARHGRFRVVSCGTQGVDQVAFWAAVHAVREGVDVVPALYLPYVNMARRHKWRGDLFSIDRFDQMIRMADEWRLCWTGPEMGRSYGQYLCGSAEAMLDDSDELLVVSMGELPGLDGRVSDAPRTVRGAALRELPVCSFEAESGATEWLDAQTLRDRLGWVDNGSMDATRVSSFEALPF